MIQLPGETWIVGCGKMAGAMVEGWQRAGVDFSKATAIRPSGRRVPGVHTARIICGGAMPRLVLLGVKPQKLDEVAPGLVKYLDSNTILVSILAGVEIASLRARFPAAGQIVRAMPNLPVSEGRGVVALAGGDGAIDALFGLLGTVVRTDSEAELAAIGSLAGAGPAYVARFIAALAKAGVERGLDPAHGRPDRAGDGARHGGNGQVAWRDDGIDRGARGQPQRDDRSGLARAGSRARRADFANARGFVAARRGAGGGGAD